MKGDETIGVIADNPYSVNDEYNNILKEGKGNKNYFVITSNNKNLKIKKGHRIAHSTQPYTSKQLDDLRERLLKLEMQDGGEVIQGKKPSKVTWLYIIDRG
jgi:restriction endonuclease